MKSKWSNTWTASTQPRKQRKFRYNAPMHTRQKLVSAHLDPKLRESFNRRSLPIHKGDEIKVMRGSKKGLKGKVSEVDLSSMKVYIEGQLRESVTGNKILIPFNPSNLMITDTSFDDKYRRKMVERKGPVKVEKPKVEPKEEKEGVKPKEEAKPKAEKKPAKPIKEAKI